MDSKVDVLGAISIGIVVATFLLNTSRVPKAIELFKECLTVHNSKALDKEKEFIKSDYLTIHLKLLRGYELIGDHLTAMECSKKLLDLLDGCSCDTFAFVASQLVTFYNRQNEVDQVKELHQKALGFVIDTGNRKGEWSSYANLGTVFGVLGDFVKAKEYLQKALAIVKEIGDREGQASCYQNLGNAFASIAENAMAEEYFQKALTIVQEIGDRRWEALIYQSIGELFVPIGKYVRAEEHFQKALAIRKEIGDRRGEASDYRNLAAVFADLAEYVKAREYLHKALVITKELDDKKGEALCYAFIGTVAKFLDEFTETKECLQKALAITKEIGDKDGEAYCYDELGTMFNSLGEYVKPEEYLRKAATIRKEISDKQGEASCIEDLGNMFRSISEYVKAKECLQEEVVIRREIGDMQGEATCYRKLGKVFQILGKYVKAEEYLQKAIKISIQTGDRRNEASSFACLGDVFRCLSKYSVAKEYLQKSLKINKEIGDIQGEALCYTGLGTLFKYLCEYFKAIEYFQKALAINKRLGNRGEEASCCGNLGNVFKSLGEYVKAEQYLQKAVAILKQIGNRRNEARCTGILGAVFQCLGEYGKAEEHFLKALEISEEIGDKDEEARNCGNLGTVFLHIGEYTKGEEYLQKALEVTKQIGDRQGESSCCGNLGSLLLALSEYAKSREYLEKAAAIQIEIGDRKGQARSYGNLGTLFQHLGEFVKAEEYHTKALLLSMEISDVEGEFQWYLCIAWDKLLRKGDINEIFSNLFASICKSEDMRVFLGDNDQFKISFLDEHVSPYRILAALFCYCRNFDKALYVVELGRARALAELMSAQYSFGKHISVDPQSWVGIEKVLKKESNCTCLYISYFETTMFLWILKATKPILFRQIDFNDYFMNEGFVRNFDDFYKSEPFRKFHLLLQEQCDDRSLIPSSKSHPVENSQRNSHAAFRLEEERADENQETPSHLALYYKLIIAPVADLLDEPEIIIVPDRILYEVPFAALKDESGKFLSETFRIRIVPSLTTLKLIQDRPTDNCSDSDALIVGNPNVMPVLPQLPCAREEAEMIGRLVGVQPLVGHQATKLTVLEMMHSASLIHFAAHGDAERGEIALAPVRPTRRILREEDYLLTMSDIAQVKVRAKLVVLSCCHSGRGQIRAEGVVGVARAFLGSCSARSVLVALWAIEDKATEQFMRRFYEQLVRGESASESLHHIMKWMRGNGFSDMREWALFMLIGDNVTFDFGK